MYIKIIEIIPTSALTFRKVPMSHKIISSYSFIPPTVLSGFLYRLIILKNGKLPPTPKSFKRSEVDLEEYYILENKNGEVYSLGAYPLNSVNFASVRMGYQDLSLGVTFTSDLLPFRTSRDQLITLLEKNKHKFKDYDKIIEKIEKSHEDYRYFKTIENIVHFYTEISERSIPDHSKASGKGKEQFISSTGYAKKLRRAPLDWDYVAADKYLGYIVSKSKKALEVFDDMENYGFKIGKEGYAYVSEVHKTLELIPKQGKFTSSTLIPVDSNVIKQKNIDLVYYFNGKSFVKEIFALNGSEADGEYFVEESDNIVIPKATLQKLGGLS